MRLLLNRLHAFWLIGYDNLWCSGKLYGLLVFRYFLKVWVHSRARHFLDLLKCDDSTLVFRLCVTKVFHFVSALCETLVCVGRSLHEKVLVATGIFVGTNVALSMDMVNSIPSLSIFMICLITSMKVDGRVVCDSSLVSLVEIFSYYVIEANREVSNKIVFRL